MPISNFFNPIQTTTPHYVNEWANQLLDKKPGGFWKSKEVTPITNATTDTSSPLASTLWKVIIFIPLVLLRIVSLVCHSEVRQAFWNKTSPTALPEQKVTPHTSLNSDQPASPTATIQNTAPSTQIFASTKINFLKTFPFPPAILQLRGEAFFEYLNDNATGSCKHVWNKLKDKNSTLDMFLIPAYGLFMPYFVIQLSNAGGPYTPKMASLLKDLRGVHETILTWQQPEQQLSSLVQHQEKTIAPYMRKVLAPDAKASDITDKERLYGYTSMTATAARSCEETELQEQYDLPSLQLQAKKLQEQYDLPSLKLQAKKLQEQYDLLSLKLQSMELDMCIPDEFSIQILYNQQFLLGKSHENPTGNLLPNLPRSATLMGNPKKNQKAKEGHDYFDYLIAKKEQLSSLISGFSDPVLMSIYLGGGDAGIHSIIQKQFQECIQVQFEILTGACSLSDKTKEFKTFVSQFLGAFYALHEPAECKKQMLKYIANGAHKDAQALAHKEAVVYAEVCLACGLFADDKEFLAQCEEIQTKCSTLTQEGKEQLRQLLPEFEYSWT